MKRQDPRWSKFLQNLIWFIITMVVLAVLLRSLRSPVFVLALWSVGLIWGSWLAFKVSQLLFKTGQLVVRDERARAYLEQALDYKTRINQAIESISGPVSQIHLNQVSAQVDTLIETIEALVVQMDNLYGNEVIRRDLQVVPQAIKDLETRLASETEAPIRTQLERALTTRHNQLDALASFQNSIEQAEIQIESTLSQLGTIYSQLLTGQSTSHVADYNRLAADIDEEVHLLQDRLEALREVKLDLSENESDLQGLS